MVDHLEEQNDELVEVGQAGGHAQNHLIDEQVHVRVPIFGTAHSRKRRVGQVGNNKEGSHKIVESMPTCVPFLTENPNQVVENH